MNPLVKKEIRLMLPVWFAVLILEAGVPWVFRDIDNGFAFLPVFFFFGVIIPAVNSFGREFSYGTFQGLMAQPIERTRIWRVKTTILLFTILSIFLAYSASIWMREYLAVSDVNSVWHFNPKLIRSDFQNTIIGSGIVALIAMAGGLWTTLLLRQAATAFWTTFLVPLGLMLLVTFFLPARPGAGIVTAVLETAAIIYIAAAFWLGRRLFYRAQDVGWGGGILSLSKWKYFDARSKSINLTRRFQPFFALVRKEIQLHGITLIGAAVLLVVQIIVFFVRAYYNHFHKTSYIITLTDFFWMFWLLFPLVIGCTTIAEERRFGTLDQQFCLPVSRRRQFAIKFVMALVFGVLLGGVMPLLLESIAGQLGASNWMFSGDEIQYLQSSTAFLQWWFENYVVGFSIGFVWWFKIYVIGISTGFGLAALFGSAWARNFLHALSIAIIIIISYPLLFRLAVPSEWWHFVFKALSAIPLELTILIMLLIFPLASVWLGYLNFCHFHDIKRIRKYNTVILSGIFLFVFIISNTIYYRPWELFIPIESPSGQVRLNSDSTVEFADFGMGSSAILPDGRLWTTVSYPSFNSEAFFRGPINRNNIMSTQFLNGTNWTKMVSGIGIRSDGTAWEIRVIFWGDGHGNFRSEIVPSQIGTDNDWAQIASLGTGPFALLKTNGSLWHYVGENHAYKDFVPSNLQRIGNDTDWVKISSGNAAQLKKRDGSVWDLNAKKNGTSFDFQVTKSLYPEASSIVDILYKAIEVDTNGNLWELSNPPKDWRWSSDIGIPAFATKMPSRGDKKWKSLTRTFGERPMIIGLRNDGTLWEWPISWTHDFDITKIRPKQLGNYSDWVALPSNEDIDGSALAADGSVWSWNMPSDSYWLRPSRKPMYRGNIFTSTYNESQH